MPIPSEQSVIEAIQKIIGKTIPKIDKFTIESQDIGYIEENNHITSLKITKQPKLKLLPHNFEQLSSLKQLDLNHNKLGLIPETTGNFSDIVSIDLSYNQISVLPHGFKRLIHLKSLNISGNPINRLPLDVRWLPYGSCIIAKSHYNALLASGLWIPSGDIETNSKGKITKLKLSHLHLDQLPPEFAQFRTLEYLDLSYNNLSYIPGYFGRFNKLKYFNISHNNISSFPAGFDKVNGLVDLNIEANEFTNLRELSNSLKNIQTLNLIGNPLRTLSPISHLIVSPGTSNRMVEIQIDPLDLTSFGLQLLRSQNFELLHQYYAISPQVLASRYANDPNSLNSEELDRLIHEATHIERQLLMGSCT
ncbi:MAG: leucine-rich repeat domain-containing protein, partial [Promethearchaeota archaeon]